MKKFLLKYKPLFFISIILVAISAFLNVYVAMVFQKLIDVTTNKSLAEFKKVVIFSVIFIIMSNLIALLSKFIQNTYVKNTMIYIKNNIFKAILGRNIQEFNEENSGKYISVLSNDITIIEEDYFNNIFMLINSLVLFLVALISLFLLSKEITIILVIGSVFSMIIPKATGNLLSSKRKLYSDSLGVFVEKIKDIFTGFDVIKCFNLDKKIKNEFNNYNVETEKNKFNFNIINCFVNFISDTTGSLMFILVFIVGVYLNIKGELTIGTLIACIQLTNYIVNPISLSINYMNKIKSIKSIAEKVNSIIAGSVEEEKGLLKVNSFKENINFEKVSFGYEKDRLAIRKIDFQIKAGEKYAFVGESGSGKSTILKLLLKNYENYTGSIKLDNTNIKAIGKDSIYNLISIIHQNVFMFDDTIKNNIILFNDYSEEHIKHTLEVSGVNNFLNKFSEGIDSYVGENGKALSGGEKQRIAIARAIIKNSPILMLDEATAALDNETAYSIENTLLNMDNITLLAITHKLWDSLLEKYNTIFVMKAGVIVEAGSFNELIAKRGYFYSLHKIQSEGTALAMNDIFHY